MLFDGVEYKPWKDEKYRCPWRCHNPDFPAPKWSTEKGFQKHLEGCSCNPAIGRDYVAEQGAVPEVFAECEDCGRPIMKFTSIWQLIGRFVCFNCREVYQECGQGYLDCCGLQLPKYLLEG